MASPSADDSVPSSSSRPVMLETTDQEAAPDTCGASRNEQQGGASRESRSVSEPTENIAKAGPSEGEPREDEENKASAAFECNICLDVARDAVISMCGHLFCWPCLHTWLETRPHRQICPVCKAGIGKDKVVPIYGRGDSNPKDPRDKPLPPRPRGQRPEPETNVGGAGGFATFGGGGAFQMSFGIGAFPFGLFTTNFNIGDRFGGARMNQGPQEGTAQFEEEQFLHKAFLWVAFAFIFWLLIA